MCLQPIDYEGFQIFMATYLENDIPEELCQHLFTSFKSKTGGSSPEMPRAGVGLLGMNGKSILTAMGRPTPEPSTMMASCSERIRGEKRRSPLPSPQVVFLKDIVCYLSLLERGTPEDKLECELQRLITSV
uniref:Diacylglycerol kinase type I N-terminal domain-containing protein n=1 Tax=Hucho hucho TaxID=62062 RepID=A0A4W5LFB1_9TELE